jgi:hypothetical protein
MTSFIFVTPSELSDAESSDDEFFGEPLSNRENINRPKYSATLFEEGHVMKGDDGNKWVVSVTFSGIRRWKKLF